MVNMVGDLRREIDFKFLESKRRDKSMNVREQDKL